MSITIHLELEAKLRARAEAEALTVEAFLKREIEAAEEAEKELTRFALEGLNSGEPIRADTAYWEEKHRRLDGLRDEPRPQLPRAT
jgi:hypothetical protein